MFLSIENRSYGAEGQVVKIEKVSNGRNGNGKGLADSSWDGRLQMLEDERFLILHQLEPDQPQLIFPGERPSPEI